MTLYLVIENIFLNEKPCHDHNPLNSYRIVFFVYLHFMDIIIIINVRGNLSARIYLKDAKF